MVVGEKDVFMFRKGGFLPRIGTHAAHGNVPNPGAPPKPTASPIIINLRL